MTDLAIEEVMRVFMASPGDVVPERNVAHEVVQEINRNVGRELGVRIDLMGWEDTLPGQGRPQAQINEEVERCDIFLGLVWKRWGSPTGEFSSGFEEEFTLASDRSERDGVPVIWLAFKKIDAASLEDPGEQLKKVLLFRQQQEVERRVFFKEVASTEDWGSQLRQWLTTHILRRYKERERSRSDTDQLKGVTAGSGTSREIVMPADPASRAVSRQLLEVAQTLQRAFSAPGAEEYWNRALEMSRFELDRLALWVQTQLSIRFAEDFLDVHRVNRLYLQRHDIEFSYPERSLLFVTMISDQNRVVPGWYWFSKASESVTVDNLLSYSIGNDRFFQSDSLQLAALRTLREIRVSLSQTQVGQLFEIIDEATVPVAIAALDLVGGWASLDLVARLEELEDHQDSLVVAQATRVKRQILARLDGDRLLDGLVEADFGVGEDVVKLLEPIAQGLSGELLVKALSARESRLTEFAIETLTARNELSGDKLESFLSHGSRSVRQAALKALIRQGRSPRPDEVRTLLEGEQKSPRLFLGLIGSVAVKPEEVLAELYATWDSDKLMTVIRFYSSDGSIAFGAMAMGYFSQVANFVRVQMSAGFSGLREQDRDEWKAQYGAHAATLEEGWKRVEGFMEAQFFAAGLAALVVHGVEADVEYARNFLRRSGAVPDEGRVSAIALIQKFGHAADVSLLLSLVHDSYGRTKRDAAAAAVRLTDDLEETLNTILADQNVDVARAGILAAIERGAGPVAELLTPHLRHQTDAIRELAIAAIVSESSDESLEELLQSYPEEENYYYNVMVWLDRVLYAPGGIGTEQRARLAELLESG